jgi:hypothetical protein
MTAPSDNALVRLLDLVAGTRRTQTILDAVALPPALCPPQGQEDRLTRAQLAMALAAILFEDLVERVPMAAAYQRDAVRAGQQLTFDHGAMRTVAAPSGELPAGRAAFTRFLEPLGFAEHGLYPLDRLGMTGRAYTHRDLPETIPQFFLSELHPEKFSPTFQAAVQRVVRTSRDPLPAAVRPLLDTLAREHALPLPDAARLLPNLAACFARQHDEPSMADYETLLRESDEMAWIATEGNAFNHVTDRVADVHAVADAQRHLGRPMKDAVEVSASGRVLQTAFRAAMVERLFVGAGGTIVTQLVPGSFYEFIERKEVAPGQLDLAFDTGNAQAIFKMTSVGSTM